MSTETARPALPPPSLREAAMAYAARGWSVMPIGPDKKPPPGSSWKRLQTVALTPTEIARDFDRDDLHGLAVLLGPVSGDLACRDYDEAAAYREWAAAHPEDAAVYPTARTARGYHVYFRCPGLRTSAQGDGEVRGAGAYTLLPPSRHPDGPVYEWLVPPGSDIPFADPIEKGLAARIATESPESSDAMDRDSDDSVLSVAQPIDPGGGWAPYRGTVQLDDLIMKTQPAKPGERERCLFHFARGMKFNVDGVSPEPEGHRDIVAEWHRRALPNIGTKPFPETWWSYKRAHASAKVPLGVDVVTAAIAAANAEPPPPCAAGYRSAEYQRLIGFCAQLQRLHGEADFPMSSRVAARAAGLDRDCKAAWRMIQVLVDDGILECVRKGVKGPAGSPASRFRYTGRTATAAA